MLQQPYIQNEDYLIGRFLFEKQSIEINKRTIYKFWQERDKKIKKRERKKKKKREGEKKKKREGKKKKKRER